MCSGERPLAWYVRRCPTLPQGLPCSTIGAERLNFRVRDGTGCFPFAMAAETLWSYRCCRGGSVPVSPEPHSGRKIVVCELSPRPVSTGQLRALRRFHVRPINPVVCWGPYQVNPVRRLILKRASRLDAFSGYPFQTWPTSRALGRTTGTPEVCPSRSSRTRDSPSQSSCARSG